MNTNVQYESSEFNSLDDARDFARLHTRIILDKGYYYARISCANCDMFLECMHPPS